MTATQSAGSAKSFWPDAGHWSCEIPLDTPHPRLDVFAERGFVQLTDLPFEIPEAEYLDLEYMDWKSGGDTNFAPIASALGAIECAGFWDHGKPDKGGVWTDNASRCPTLVEWTRRVGADFGRVRIIKLEPNVMPDVERWIHLDDNNRLNPEGTGRVVRAWLQLTDDPDSCMILRADKDDRDGEVRIPLRRGTQFVVDSERMWHGVYHSGPEPRYALIVSFESGPALQDWIDANRIEALATR
jgi:hypothetical protein